MTTQLPAMIEINEKAIRVLYKELGPVAAIRFLNQYSTGSGDYTRDRADMFDHLTLDEIFAEVENKQRRVKASSGTKKVIKRSIAS